MNDEEYWETQLRSIVAGRRWILANDVLASCRGLVETLHELGASGILCIAGSPGTGPQPDLELAPNPIVLDLPPARTAIEGIRQAADALANLGPSEVAQVDAFDLDGSARVIGPMFDDGRPVAGRVKYGARPPTWQQLEDKTIIDALWEELEIKRAPHQVVPVARGPMKSALETLDQGAGVVFVGDNREGFHGGAELLRWVRNGAELNEAREFLVKHCNTARAMPFLEGIPCSIHGMVFPNHVLALRPCEMVVLRKPGTSRLHYSRAASFWDPRPADREYMRSLAREVGRYLRESIGYRGAFTIDGIMSAGGFVPTELNPRWGAALSTMLRGFRATSPGMINRAVVEGESIDWRPRQLEARLLQHADEHRAGGGLAMTPEPQPEREGKLAWDSGSWRWAVDGEPAAASASLGPSPAGGICFVNLVSEETPEGASVAGRIASALMFLDQEWDLGIGVLKPALDIR